MAARSSAPVIGALCSTSDPKAEKAKLSEDESPLSARHWSISTAYRYQHSFRHFVGTTEQTQRETQETAVVNYLNLFEVSVTYKINPRWSLTASLPIMNATRTYDHQLFDVLLHIPNAPDQVTHANGIGDLAVSAQFWLHRPPAEKGHNIAFSFGTVFRPVAITCATLFRPSMVRNTSSLTNPSNSVPVDGAFRLGPRLISA